MTLDLAALHARVLIRTTPDARLGAARVRVLRTRHTTALGATRVRVLLAPPAPPPPDWRAIPGMVSHELLAAAGLDPHPTGPNQPLFVWQTHTPAGWVTDPPLSAALTGWNITHGRPNARDQVGPNTATFTLLAPFMGATPQLGDRCRVAVGDQLAEASLIPGHPRFTGEVTDVVLDPARSVAQVTAVGRWARASRREVTAAASFPVEADGYRVARVLAAVLPDAAGQIDPGAFELATPPAAETAAGLVATAAASTAGQLVENRDGTLDWHDPNHRRGSAVKVVLTAAELLTGFTWAQRVGDVCNKMTVGYADGRTVTVTDETSVAARDEYPAGVDTALTTAADAQVRGALTVGRFSAPTWQLPAVTIDLLRSVPADKIPALLALRHGDLITLAGLPPGGPFTGAKVYVEGVTDVATPRSWRLTLHVSDPATSSAFLRWKDVPPGVKWSTVDPSITWLDVARFKDQSELL